MIEAATEAPGSTVMRPRAEALRTTITLRFPLAEAEAAISATAGGDPFGTDVVDLVAVMER
jgi:hypothetical protein